MQILIRQCAEDNEFLGETIYEFSQPTVGAADQIPPEEEDVGPSSHLMEA